MGTCSRVTRRSEGTSRSHGLWNLHWGQEKAGWHVFDIMLFMPCSPMSCLLFWGPIHILHSLLATENLPSALKSSLWLGGLGTTLHVVMTPFPDSVLAFLGLLVALDWSSWANHLWHQALVLHIFPAQAAFWPLYSSTGLGAHGW